MKTLSKFSDIIVEAWKSKELRRRILFTIGVLMVFRIGASITIPGVSIPHNSQTSGNGLIDSLGILGGGGLRYFSIFAMGVSPYITASIVIQLLSTNVVPYLTNLAKSGEKGRKTQDLITRYLTIIFGILQAVGITSLLISQKAIQLNSSIETYAFIILFQLGGVFLALWLGDQINEHGLGNGVSMIILSGVVASIPYNFFNVFEHFLAKNKTLTKFVLSLVESFFVLFFYLFLVFISTFFNQSYRNIPVQNIGSGLSKSDNNASYLVLRINIAGVIPVIFATALLSIPVTIARYVQNSDLTLIFNFLFNRQYPTALITDFIFITIFTYFYSKITVNPDRFAENLQKSGSFIPGIPPGYQTSRYINTIINRLNFFGALFLSTIAIIPYIFLIIFKLPVTYGIGGTGLLIYVVVAINLFAQLKARITQIEYRKLKSTDLKDFGIW